MTLVDCNLVLKGGVTSGLVHAGAVPEVARLYRLRGVAGSSAGAIAAAFAAAAEYARSQGDLESFARLQRHSAELPFRLPDLFQPSPGLKRLAAALVRLAPGTGRARVVAGALCFWPALIVGFAAGAGVWALLAGRTGFTQNLVGSFLLGVFGAVITFGLDVGMLLRLAARHNFGLCSGLSKGVRPALTDWLHASLQDIAFGPKEIGTPLTFGHLDAAGINLKIVATNLASGQPVIAPDLGLGLGFRPAEWARQFPTDVLAHVSSGSDDNRIVRPIPPSAELPVVVAVRMSFACPGLMEATPAVGNGGARVWFSDGGLTNNFPFTVFDGDAHPTFAIDIDTIHQSQADEPRAREFKPDREDPTPSLITLRGFVWSLLVALREGHLRAAARASGRQARMYQVRLRVDEGGMRLDMAAAEAEALIEYGKSLGRLIVEAEAVREP